MVSRGHDWRIGHVYFSRDVKLRPFKLRACAVSGTVAQLFIDCDDRNSVLFP